MRPVAGKGCLIGSRPFSGTPTLIESAFAWWASPGTLTTTPALPSRVYRTPSGVEACRFQAKAGTVADGTPSTAILIVPGENRTGSIENLCWDAVRDLPASRCVDEYLRCLRQNAALDSANESKTRVHAYLASRADPTTTVGVGAIKGYWPLEHQAFDDLRRFVRLIAEA